MTDLERLEAAMSTEIAAALRRYAAEADTAIDAAETAHLIASRHPRRRWLGGVADSLPFPAHALGRAVLVMAALLLLLLAAIAVGQSLFRGSVRDALVRGHLECVQAAPGTSSRQGATVVTTGIVLSCRLEAGDGRARGALSLTVTRTLLDGRNGVDVGTATLDSGAGMWHGDISGLIVEDGRQSLNLSLDGEDPFRGQHLGLRLISLDGLSWAVSGTVGSIR